MAHPDDPQALANACAEAMYARDHTAKALGIAVTAVGPGTATLAMTVRETMVNGHAICHGGMIFTLADTAFSYACNAYNVVTVAQHCSISFLQPGRLGQRLIATAREVTREGRSGLYDIRVTAEDADGTALPGVLAEFRGHSRTLGGPVIEETG
jgi:acyl-CoA thioesterase